MDPGYHSIFIELNDGVRYKGWNSYGTTKQIIQIQMNNFEENEQEIEI